MEDLVSIKTSFPDSVEIKNRLVEKYNYYSLSRYKRQTILYDEGTIYATMYPEDMSVKSESYSEYIVPKCEEGRLDLVANRVYGDSTLFWVIGYYNEIVDPFSIKRGDVLKIPPLASLYRSGGVLS